MKRVVTFFLACLATGLGACAVTGNQEAPTAWTHAPYDNDDRKFTFALFSDLTGGERPDIFRVAVEQLNLLRPEFVMSVGDLIEGGSRDPDVLNAEWDSFDERADRARARIYRVGGNHDLTNTVMWDTWKDRYGPLYYHFMYEDVLFLALNTEDNSPERQDYIDELRTAGLERVKREGWGIYRDTEYAQTEETNTGRVGPEQALYFKKIIEQHPDVRWTFVFMHKPAWRRPNEENFLQIERALEDRPYTVFYGHLHDYKYQQRFGRDYIQLGTTGGVQMEGKDMAIDHVTLVTVSEGEPDIANIRLSGIFDKSGHLPLNGDELCFEAATCAGR